MYDTDFNSFFYVVALVMLFQIANQEIGLIPSLKAACGAENIRFQPPKESE